MIARFQPTVTGLLSCDETCALIGRAAELAAQSLDLVMQPLVGDDLASAAQFRRTPHRPASNRMVPITAANASAKRTKAGQRRLGRAAEIG